MKFVKPQKLYVWSFWLPMPLIIWGWIYILYEDRMWTDWKVWVVTTPIIYFMGYFSWYGHVQYTEFVMRKFPSIEQTVKRIIYTMGMNLLVMTPSVILILYVFQFFHILGYSIEENDIKYAYLLGLSVNLIFGTLWEAVYIIDKYKENSIEKELLEKMQLQQEFDNLKQRINPHFLFNCFNTLSALITENKQKTDKFLDELSKVYRYLLRNNENDMSTLESEIKFIESYWQLLKTRHDESLNFNVSVDKKYYTYLLPSLSLQLLVENVVKHNTLSKQQPITISIRSTDREYLVVENNLARKKTRTDSTGIGLSTIRDKYKLLRADNIEVDEFSDDKFTVKLPLIRP
ncbi:sensor histidine kinase [Terrimonas pollutisoli]|uniref:sensor histidine kinase n=1 Tax=Terrimonas pollutisoli TaxID=3034147 RepID=UPI0023EBD806|nr:histidine kinase [Terrimonas sp. H1YJ31]